MFPDDDYADEVAKARAKKAQEEAAKEEPKSNGHDKAGEEPEPPPQYRKPLKFLELGMEPPARDWAIKFWIPKKAVTLLAGAPGMGKTLCTQAMGSSAYLKRPYLDEVPNRQRVLMWMCEEDHDELWRRQVAISRHLMVPLATFENGFYIQPLEGADVELCSPGVFDNRQKLLVSPVYYELLEQVADYRADIVVLDTVARIYGGNENDRHQVTTFISLLTTIANIRGSSIILCAHPAKVKGSEFSGSTAWEGSCRSRLYLSRTLPGQKRDDDDDEEDLATIVDNGIRYLSRRKSNYSGLDSRRLQIANGGVMIPDPPEGKAERATYTPEFVRDEVLRCVAELRGMGLFASSSLSARNYLPKLIQHHKLCPTLRLRQLEEGMIALLKDETLVTAEVGKYGNRTVKHGLVLRTDCDPTPTGGFILRPPAQ